MCVLVFGDVKMPLSAAKIHMGTIHMGKSHSKTSSCAKYDKPVF